MLTTKMQSRNTSQHKLGVAFSYLERNYWSQQNENFFAKLLTPCLHLGIYRSKRLLTKPWSNCTVFILAQITEVNLSSITITINLNWRQSLNSMHKMPAFIEEAVALVVLSFYFLVFEQQTQVSRFQRFYFCSTARSRGKSY